MKEKINENRSTDENDNHPKITIEPIETVREHEHNDTRHNIPIRHPEILVASQWMIHQNSGKRHAFDKSAEIHFYYHYHTEIGAAEPVALTRKEKEKDTENLFMM